MSLRGRRPAGADTAADIMAAARACFAERGFDATTIRQVAERAGVDPALVHHYYGAKRELFITAMQIPFDVTQAAHTLARVPRTELGEAILRFAVPVWDGPRRADIAAILRTGLGDGANHTLLQEVVVEGIASPVLRVNGMPEDEIAWRAPLLETVMLGVMVSRVVMDVPVVAAMNLDQVVASYAPVLQRFLTAPREQLFPETETARGSTVQTEHT